MQARPTLVGAALLLAALSSCDGATPSSGSPSAAVSSTAPAPALFDEDGFCEKTMSVPRKCEGEDTFMEGNKVGLCATTLRTAREDDGVKLDQALGLRCVADVKKANPSLPNIRTLKTLAERIESCRTLLKALPLLATLAPLTPGTTALGKGCEKSAECSSEAYCAPKIVNGKPGCAPKRKAGERCANSGDCLGRCSRKQGDVCVAYCGKG